MSRLFACAIAVAALCGPCFGAEPDRNAIGAGVVYLSPSSPLESGAGIELEYRHTLVSKSDPTHVRLILTGDLGFVPLDREAEGQALEGAVDLVRVSGDVLWPLLRGRWALAVGGGIDWLIGDGDGDFVSDPQTAVTNDYEVDAGVGFHATVEVSRAIGSRWQLVARAEWLEAELDGEHRFVVSGVPGAPTDVTFDFGGPVVRAGVAWTF